VAVLKGGFLGFLSSFFKPLFFIVNIAADEELIRKIHHDVKEFVEECSPAKWPRGALDHDTYSFQYRILAVLGD
jgi:hypothetical protein